MTYLLDTNVISEVRRPQPDVDVLAWLDLVDEELLYLSVITVGELARGVALLPDGKRKAALAEWLGTDLQLRFGHRLLSIDGEAAFIWGRLMADATREGRALSVMDGWIAAIALRHHLIIATRNVRDFENLGLEIFNPWGPRNSGSGAKLRNQRALARVVHIAQGDPGRNVMFLSYGC